jgi:hypothetical protein
MKRKKNQVYLESRAMSKEGFRALGVVHSSMSHCRAGSTYGQRSTIINASTSVPVFGSFITYLSKF